MITEPWNLEPLRRSMVLGRKDLPSGLTNGEAAEVIGFALQLEQRMRLLEAGHCGAPGAELPRTTRERSAPANVC